MEQKETMLMRSKGQHRLRKSIIDGPELFQPRGEAQGPAARSRRSCFCRAARSQMGFSQLGAAPMEATKWLGDRHGGCPRHFGRWPGLHRRWRSWSPAFRYC